MARKKVKRRDNTKIALIVIVVILLAAAVFYFRGSIFPKKQAAATSLTYTLTYNGFDFAYVDGLWYTVVKSQDHKFGFKIALHYNPGEIKDFPVDGNLSAFLPVTKGYIAFDPMETQLGYVIVANGELSLTLATAFKAVQLQPLNLTTVCTKNDYRGCGRYPILDCNTSKEKVVYLRQSDDPRIIVVNQTCIIVQGRDYDLVKGVDRILYSWFNVMP